MDDPKDSIFENNLRLLSRSNNQIAEALRGIEVPSSVRVFLTESGLFTAEVKITPDCTKLIHSAFHPLKEAREWAEMQNISADVFVLLGIGLGYPALAILDGGFSGKLMIAEKDTGIFKLAAMHCNLTGILKNKNVSLFVGKEADSLISYLHKEKPDHLSYRIYQPATSLHPEFYEKISLNLDKIILAQHRISNPQLFSGLEYMLQVMKE